MQGVGFFYYMKIKQSASRWFSTCLTDLWKLWRNLNDYVMQEVGFLYYMKNESDQPAEGLRPEK